MFHLLNYEYMKNRTYICLMFFLLMSLPIYSQNIKVTVVDKDGNALSYASININKGHCCITNIDGVALIPLAKLNFGDTIMATYIGLSPGMIIYSEKMQNESEILTLDSEKLFEISPVVIMSDFNHWNYFNKKVKPNSVKLPNCIVRGDFEITNNNIKGSFNLDNTKDKRAIYNFMFSSLPTITSNTQDTILRDQLKRVIANIIQTSYQMLSRIKAEHRAKFKYSNISYLGIIDNYNCFRLVYTTKELQNKLSFQMEFLVDRDSYEIKSIKYFTPSKDRVFSSDQNNLISAYYIKRSSQRKNKNEESMLPNRIEFNFTNKNNQLCNLVLLNLDFQFF